MIHFVGSGPGAPDLITLRGAKLLGEADCVIYAGSLVNPELLALSYDDLGRGALCDAGNGGGGQNHRASPHRGPQRLWGYPGADGCLGGGGDCLRYCPWGVQLLRGRCRTGGGVSPVPSSYRST